MTKDKNFTTKGAKGTKDAREEDFRGQTTDLSFAEDSFAAWKWKTNNHKMVRREEDDISMSNHID